MSLMLAGYWNVKAMRAFAVAYKLEYISVRRGCRKLTIDMFLLGGQIVEASGLAHSGVENAGTHAKENEAMKKKVKRTTVGWPVSQSVSVSCW